MILGALAVMMRQNFGSDPDLFFGVFAGQAPLISSVFALTFLNLFLETQKWRTLIGEDAPAPSHAFRAILRGICTGLLTPNRVGEFVGRAAALPKGTKTRGSVMTFAGSTIQGVITILMGCIGLFCFPLVSKIAPYINPNIRYLILPAAVACILMVAFRFKKSIREKLYQFIQPLKRLNASRLGLAFCLGLLRYIVFSTQFVIALHAMGYSGALLSCYAGIFVLYFFQSYIPFSPMGELGIREMLAVMLFGAFMPDPVYAAFAGLLIWLANLGLPVLFGVVTMPFSKIPLVAKS